MNRKRHNTILALPVAAMIAAVGLVAAGSLSRSDDSAAAMAERAMPIDPTPDQAPSPANRPVDALAPATGAVASRVAAATPPLAGSAVAASEGTGLDASLSDATESRGRAKRRAIAVPYFSFAQGLRSTRS